MYCILDTSAKREGLGRSLAVREHSDVGHRVPVGTSDLKGDEERAGGADKRSVSKSKDTELHFEGESLLDREKENYSGVGFALGERKGDQLLTCGRPRVSTHIWIHIRF